MLRPERSNTFLMVPGFLAVSPSTATKYVPAGRTRLGVPRSSMYSFGASEPGGLKRISLIQISPRAEAQASQSSPNNIGALGRLNRFISEVALICYRKGRLTTAGWHFNGRFK